MDISIPQRGRVGSGSRLLARKLRSAITVYRRKGIAPLTELAQARAAALYLAHRPIPQDATRRGAMLAATINRWSGVSPLVLGSDDTAAVRDGLLMPYLRHRFAEVVALGLQIETPSPLEIVVLADSMLSTWDYQRLDGVLPGWSEAVAGTQFARRIAQTARRAALRLGRLAEAASPIPEDVDDKASLMLRADVCDALGHMEQAAAAYEAAVQRDGADPFIRLNYGFHLLKSGRIRDGLANWLLSDTLSGHYPSRRHRPRWTGEPLGSRRLMILFEHGLGDMIQMARFLPRLLAREPRATVMARVPAPLAGLMARSFPRIAFVTEEEAEPDYDLFAPSMHLPVALDAPDLAPASRYIPLGVSAAGHDRPRIGICWRGHPRQYEATRSIPLALFSTLFAVAEADFVVLLNRLMPEEQALLSGFGNVETPEIGDFVDLAGVVGSCDLIVTVDTAVAHLAGAGGQPVLLLSRPDGCWRWGVSGARSPWYDTVEVMRHGGDMDWAGMLGRVTDRIRQRCGRRALVDAGS